MKCENGIVRLTEIVSGDVSVSKKNRKVYFESKFFEQQKSTFDVKN